MSSTPVQVAGLTLACALLPQPSLAQSPPLVLPRVSPRAMVSQTIGLTAITITYDRPGINDRKVWGELVPYDSVWRAGANENTTISFTSPVTVGGQTLEAGRYGLHMIPTPSDWTVIFSRESSAWGSFSYDPKEDAARVKVTPQPAALQERLSYTLEDPTANSVVATLRWEKLAVPLTIKVDVPSVVADSLRQQLRGLPRFSWQGWNQAAAWCLQNNTNLDEALTWSDQSIALNENFTNLRVKAAILDRRGDGATAARLLERALPLATENELNSYGYLLLGQGKNDEAIEIFRKNVKSHPQSWNTYDSLGEAYAKNGEKKLAVANYNKALSMVQDSAQKKRIGGILAGLQ